METDTRKLLMDLLQEKLHRLDIHESQLGGSFDLVKSGLLNSLEFVDLVATLEKNLGLEIDFEKALNSGDFTTVNGIVKVFKE
jgi:acyl carrier protein